MSWSITKFDGSWKQSFSLLSPTRDQQYLMSPYIITTELIIEPGAHYLRGDQQYLMSPYIITTELIIEPGAHYLRGDQQYLMSPYIITTELIIEPGAHYSGVIFKQFNSNYRLWCFNMFNKEKYN